MPQTIIRSRLVKLRGREEEERNHHNSESGLGIPDEFKPQRPIKNEAEIFFVNAHNFHERPAEGEPRP